MFRFRAFLIKIYILLSQTVHAIANKINILFFNAWLRFMDI